MRTVGIDQIEDGMTIGEDVRDINGRLVLNRGVIVGKQQVRALKMWGIRRVPVIGGDGEPEPEVPLLSAEALAAVELSLRDIFCLTQSTGEHPLVSRLRDCSRQRMIRRGGPPPSVALAAGAASPSASGGAPKMRRLVASARNLAPPPAVYERLRAVVAHPHSSANDIGNVINQDPSLAAKLLRMANSALYGLPRRIETISQAVVVLGTAQLCDLVLATAVIQAFNRIPPGLVDPMSFWEHCVSCALVARGIAQQRREANVERLFLGGLLHDLGRAILLLNEPDHTRQALCAAAEHAVPVYESERSVFGFDHAELGAALVEDWNLPEGHCEMIRFHHEPGRARRFLSETQTVYLADLTTNALRLGDSGEKRAPPLDPEVWEALQLDVSAMDRVLDQIEAQVADLAGILKQEPT